MSRNSWRTCRVLALPAACLLLWGCSPEPVPTSLLLERARRALSERQFDRAEKLAGQIPQSSLEWADAMAVAGEAAAKAGRLRDALRHYRTLAERNPGSVDSNLGWFFAAEIHRELGELSDAEIGYRTVLDNGPTDVEVIAHRRLAFLLSVTGRSWEAREHYWFLITHWAAQKTELIPLADPDRPVSFRDYLEECAEKAPGDNAVQLGLAAHALWDGDRGTAEKLLRSVLAADPKMAYAHALLGELLVTADAPAFQDWYSQRPAAAETTPHFWFVLGLRARYKTDLRAAARCFWETIRLVPSHRSAQSQLGQLLLALKQPAGAEFLERADRLAELTRTLNDVMRSEWRDQAAVKTCVELFRSTGRIWEACAWARTANKQFPRARWPREVFAKLAPNLRDMTVQTAPESDLARRFDFSSYPRYRGPSAGSARPVNSADSGDLSASIRFEEAHPAGFKFVYFNAPDPKTEGVRVFESNGGGVAVVDFDRNGRPDLYFTQGAEWETGEDEPTETANYTDRLFWNRPHSFEDVTQRCGLGSRGFGQGCTVGDFDSDGFADIYVANIGRNRLYRNCGDGTFCDVTATARFEGAVWTSGCAFVDLNRDGHPDLFDVNYLQGEGLHQMICNRIACSPSNYAGAPDVIHLNRGDGTFQTLDHATPRKGAKGLGLAVFYQNPREAPWIFVANDQTPNFLLKTTSPAHSLSLELSEEGFARGVAVSSQGTAYGCMGVAADDADGNGLVDLFVTNYYNEPNTLYLQDAPDLFSDTTGPAGFVSASKRFVGWGTQFLDADLDGDPDLVVANGHVDDYRGRGGEYRMHPQFFRNRGRARFEQVPAAEAGDYFERKFLGRGLAKLDWNLDGRIDFVVSNIGAPASLVTNRTRSAGHFLNLKLHARNSSRDAIGTRVTVIADGRRWIKQLTAGDGYQAGNERMIQFGVGIVPQIDRLKIEWPSGSITTLSNLPVDATYEVVEDQTRATRWTGDVTSPFSTVALTPH